MGCHERLFSGEKFEECKNRLNLRLIQFFEKKIKINSSEIKLKAKKCDW